MKKALFFAGLAAAALSFSACNKETSVSWLDATPMKVVLSTAETRTTTDGIHTSWAEGDKINVIHAEAGTTEYKNDTPYQDGKTYPFVVSDAEAGTFTGKLMGGDLEADKSYDWYFFYPYSSYIVSPVNSSTSGGYAYIGGRSDQSQTQTGNNSKTHLAGGNSAACFPLYGVKKNVPAGEQPAATMKHIASAVAVTVKNETDEPITISQVEFTAPENIVGQFYISFDQETPTFENQKYSAATASLTVKEGTAIAKGATATFYIGIKPFTAKAGDKLSLKITTTAEKVVEKELTLPSSVEFKPGLIKTLNVSFDKGQDVETQSLAEIKELETGADVHTQEVLVVAKYAQGIMLGQEGVYLLAYNKDGVDANVGDIVKVSGKMGAYTNNNNGKSYPQITGPEVTFISGDNPVVLPEPKVLTTLDGYDQIYPELIQYTGTLAVSGSYYNVTVPGSTNVGSIQYPLNPDEVKAFDKKVVTVTGFFVGMSGNKFYVNTMLTSIEESSANAFDVAEREISVPATATSAEIQVTGNVDWTVDPQDGILSADPLSGTGEGTVTVTFAANTDTSNPKEYTVFIRTEAEGVEDEIPVIITQAAAAEGVTIFWNDYADWGLELDGEGKIIDQETISLTCGDYLVTMSKDAGKTNPTVNLTYKDARAYAKAKVTVKNTKNVYMKKVVFNISVAGLKRLAPITASVGTVADQATGDNTVTWTGEATEVTFTVGEKAEYGSDGASAAGQLDFDSINVIEGGQAPAKILESISVEGAKTDFVVGDAFTFGGVVTATYNDGSTKDVTASAHIEEPDMTTAGEKTVNVTYTEGGITQATSYKITVTADSGDDPVFVKVTSTSDLVSGKYLIVNETASVAMTDAVDEAGNKIAVTISNDKIAATTETRAVAFTFTATNGAFKGANGKYLAHSGSTNGIKPSDDPSENTVTFSEGNALITAPDNYFIQYNKSSGQERFRYYKNAQGDGAVQLYKLINDGGEPPVEATLESISLSGQRTSYFVGDAYALDGTVTAHYSDGSTKNVTSSASVPTPPDMSTTGTKEVTVSYTEGEITKTANYSITVSASASHAGTAEDPFTVTEAVTTTMALGLGNTSADAYYTKGIVSQVDEVSAEHGNATYFISDDGSTTGQFEVFRGKYIGNIDFSDASQLQVGDEVVVYGKFTYYKNTSTPEIAQGNYITSLKRDGAQVYALNASAAQTSVGAAATTVKVNVYGNVSWTASVTGGATLDASTGSGMGSFNVSIPENTSTESGKTYTVTVSGTGVPAVTITISQSKKETAGEGVTVTVGKDYLAANKDGSLDSVISYTNDTDYGGNSVTELRVYKGKKFTVTASGGHLIKSIKITCTKNGTTKEGPGCWGTGAPEGYTFESDGPHGTWTGSASSVVFTAKDNQVRITELTVTYE